ncbi:acetyltransferase [Bernardetia litoralis DSM 6794]|uniref:Acetyltransferase n=1 Tax=Bernardetia litoralis (strain ATCC 23117 / DSM 6794 / NBRC 15988 / NCIMB 1366 / Fx l1 / Sio-4) TaxID=880071 RepID=I4AHL0_BERLS|nr:GNAT family N-acetyltransferase [Bernardetia litoralis]AFM03445.1 acetyltransferase [Bernardetia litoralis DSM 6794]
MSISIKKLTPESTFDNTLLEEINEFLFKHLEQYGDPKADIKKAMEYSLSKEAGKGGYIFYAIEEEKIVGATVINETGMTDYIPENILVYIAVDGSQRGKGIGQKIMTEAMNSVKGSVALHVEPNNPAKKLYERLGFENKYLEMRWKK